jgi:hypothetical protein
MYFGLSGCSLNGATSEHERDVCWALQYSYCVAIYMFRCPFIKESLIPASRPSNTLLDQSERKCMLMVGSRDQSFPKRSLTFSFANNRA